VSSTHCPLVAPGKPAADPLTAYRHILKARGEQPHKALWQLRRLLAGIRIENARVLDIGAGWGRHTLYFAAAGAREVIALEPESAGAGRGAADRLEYLVRACRLRNVRVLRQEFLTAPLDEGTFDLVFAHAVINHMCETRQVIRIASDAGRYYLRVFGRMRRLLQPDGVAIIVDANRRNIGLLLQTFGLRHPLLPDIDWRLHQTPPTWKHLMRRAGFRRFELQYACPYALRRIAGWWANAFTDFFTYGMFSIRAYR
jgi:SAM-dependent methyltransferase